MYVKEQGNKQGEILVFIHGGGISGWMCDKQMEHFNDYYCLVPDLPEHGKSINEGPISIKGCANLIVDLIEKKSNGRKVNIVGHSLGAKIVLELLNTRPEIVHRAVVASALCRDMPLMKFSHKLSIYKLTTAMLKVNWILDFQVKQFEVPDKISADSLKKDFQSMTPSILYRIYDEVYQNLVIPAGLQNMNVPTLVVAGEREPKAMKESVKDLVQSIPKSKGVLLIKGQHTYPWVLYDDFNKIIRAWINNKKVSNKQVIQL